jgi:hypothetical protein
VILLQVILQVMSALHGPEKAEKEAQRREEWESLSANDPANATARAMHGILRFRAANLDQATVAMLEGCDRSRDWVALQYAAAAYGMMARRLTSVKDGAGSGQERAALTQAASLFSAAEAALAANPVQIEAPEKQTAPDQTPLLDRPVSSSSPSSPSSSSSSS